MSQKKSIFSKIFLGFLGIIAFISISILLLAYSNLRNNHLETQIKHQLTIAQFIKPDICENIFNHQNKSNAFPLLQDLVVAYGEKLNLRITVIQSSGKVIADSNKDPSQMDNHKYRPEISEALKGRKSSISRFSNTLKAKMLYTAIPIKKDNENWGALRVSLFLEDIDKFIGQAQLNTIILSIIAIAFSLFIAYFISRNISQPIRKLQTAANQIAQGNFNIDLEIKNQDELKLLASHFRHMSKKLQSSFNELSKQKEDLIGIINSLHEGLIVCNKDKKILLCNNRIEKVFRNDTVGDKNILELVNSPTLNTLIEKCFSSQEDQSAKIALFDETYVTTASFLTGLNAIVITFYDITSIEKVEKIKKELIVNVSHELRTPLTAIKGYIETLESDLGNYSQEEMKEFLNILHRNTDRLINIVKDLLILSEVEEIKETPFKKIDINKTIQSCIATYQNKLDEKKLSLRFHTHDNPPLIMGDEFKLEQVFINLIDNAIKYTDSGSIDISIKRDNIHRFLLITITDTGVGIPSEHLDRIFERFYVVDKSRAKKLGGTGLGLSIVKNIIDLHKGSIVINSIENQGTTFTINLPF